MVVFSDLLLQVETLHSQSTTSHVFNSLQKTTATNKTSVAAGRQELLMKSLSQFEKVYTLRLSTRLSESINQLFTGPGRNLPRKEDLLAIIKQLNRYQKLLLILSFIVYARYFITTYICMYIHMFFLLVN